MTGDAGIAEAERLLLALTAPGRFGMAELAGLPEPARQYLAQAIAPGAPMARSALIRMRGSIRIGAWLPFRAREVLSPHEGFVWRARVGGVISGWDRYADGTGGMDWRLAGHLPLLHAEGPDVARSAAGRAGAEGMWAPTALLPRFGVRWTADDDRHITVHYQLGDAPLDIRYELDGESRIVSLVFDRWGDPDGTGTWGWHPFGGEVTRHRTFGGVTIPSAGRVGWFFGTERWPAGASFRYLITDLELVTALEEPAGGT